MGSSDHQIATDHHFFFPFLPHLILSLVSFFFSLLHVTVVHSCDHSISYHVLVSFCVSAFSSSLSSSPHIKCTLHLACTVSHDFAFTLKMYHSFSCDSLSLLLTLFSLLLLALAFFIFADRPFIFFFFIRISIHPHPLVVSLIASLLSSLSNLTNTVARSLSLSLHSLPRFSSVIQTYTVIHENNFTDVHSCSKSTMLLEQRALSFTIFYLFVHFFAFFYH